MSYTLTTTHKRIFLAVFAAVFILLLWMLRFYFWPFMIALIIYLILDKPYLKMYVALGKKKTLSAIIMVAVILLVLFVPLGFLIGSLATEAIGVSQSLANRVTIEQIDAFLAEENIITQGLKSANLDIETIDERAIEYLENYSSTLFDGIRSALLSSFNAVLNFLFMVIFLFFLFRDGEKIKKRFYKIMPYPDELEKRIVHRMGTVTKDVFYGNIVITFLQGAAISVGLAIFGVPHPILLGLVAGIFSLIPVVGTFIVWIPVAIYLYATGDAVPAFVLSVWAIVANLVLDNVIKPKILDKKLNLHPMIVFFALLGGLQVFGFAGIILGPIIAVLFIALWEIVRDWDQIKEDFNILEEKK
ncbi:AI-2E family transporter [Patescibacteria group bacterium]